MPTARSGPGQHPFDGHRERPAWVILPDDHAAVLDRQRARITGLQFQPGIRETGAQPALVRPARARFEAWQDEAVNVP